jgi:hypothetical protein
MVNLTYSFKTFSDWKKTFRKFQNYFKKRGWNANPMLSMCQWGDWLGCEKRTPYLQLHRMFDEGEIPCFEITIRSMTDYMDHEDDLNKIALKYNSIRNEDLSSIETLPAKFVQQSLDKYFRKHKTCITCGGSWDCDYGHNPSPCCDYGRCCDMCNVSVIKCRMIDGRRDDDEELEKIINQVVNHLFSSGLINTDGTTANNK